MVLHSLVMLRGKIEHLIYNNTHYFFGDGSNVDLYLRQNERGPRGRYVLCAWCTCYEDDNVRAMSTTKVLR